MPGLDQRRDPANMITVVMRHENCRKLELQGLKHLCDRLGFARVDHKGMHTVMA